MEAVQEKIKVGSKIVPLLSSVITLSMIFFDSSMLPIIIPVIQPELSISALLLRWVINIYFLCCASFVIFGGKIGDAIGYRKTFFIGMTVFGLSTVCAGSATSGVYLLLSRAIQGVAASLIAPSAMSILLYTYPPKGRNKIIGIVIGVSSIFLAIGPFIAALITHYFSWRFLFFLFVPFTILGSILAVLLDKDKWGRQDNRKIGLTGFLLISLIIGFADLAIMNGQYWGWFSFSFNFCLLISALSLVLLYLLNKYQIIQMMDLSLLKIKSFKVGLIILFSIQFPMMNTILWWIFFQKALQYDPFQTGLLSLVYAIPSVVIPPFSGVFSDKHGYSRSILLGHVLVLIGISFITLFVFARRDNYLYASLFAYGAGISIILTSVSALALKDVPSYQRGVASGVYNTVRFGATSFAFALISSVGSHMKYNQMQNIIEHTPGFQSVPLKEISDVLTGKEKLSAIYPPVSEEVFYLLKQGFVNISLDVFQMLNFLVCCFVFFSLFISIRYFKNNAIYEKIFLKIE